MEKSILIGSIIGALVIVLIAYNNFPVVEEYDWESDGVQLMQHETDGFYACFSCNVPKGTGPAMCIDPIIEMKLVEETEERYCNDDFEVIEK